MSLISIRNIAGPLKSKFQIGALVIVTVLVLVIRLGASRSSSRDEVRAVRQNASAEDLLDTLQDGRRSKSAKPSRTKDDLLDELVAGGIDENAQPQAEEPEKNESFDEIRKSLGLE
jgi:hypothetical protein